MQDLFLAAAGSSPPEFYQSSTSSSLDAGSQLRVRNDLHQERRWRKSTADISVSNWERRTLMPCAFGLAHWGSGRENTLDTRWSTIA
jgi:hypothetical protein